MPPRITEAQQRRFARWLVIERARLDKVAREEAAAIAAGRRIPVSPLREALEPYLTLQSKVDREVAAMLRDALGDLERQIASISGKKGVGAAARRAELMSARSAILKNLKNIWKETGNIVASHYADAAIAASESITTSSKALNRVLASVYSPEEVAAYHRAAAMSAEKAVLSASARVSGVGAHRLSERVWRSRQVIEGQLNRIINTSLAMGLDAREFAKRARPFLSPAIPGGARYAAMRLARTEINNAFHAAAQKQMEESPWTEFAKWNLSSSHPRADECDEHASHTVRGRTEVGLWPLGEVPKKPHPHCLCYITAVTIEPDEFMTNLLAGRYDSIIVNDDGTFRR